MADELELDVVENKKSNVVLIIAVMAISLLIGGGAAWFFLGSSGGGSKSSKAEEALLPLEYLTLTPEFVVNFPPNTKVRYLQIDVQVATRSSTALEDMATYNPVIRNDILVLLSSLSFEELSSQEGKTKLQRKILNVTNKVLSSIVHEGSPKKKKKKKKKAKEMKEGEHAEGEEMIEGPIENIYFTSFIMQ